jgi:hypothetical protein
MDVRNNFSGGCQILILPIEKNSKETPQIIYIKGQKNWRGEAL